MYWARSYCIECRGGTSRPDRWPYRVGLKRPLDVRLYWLVDLRPEVPPTVRPDPWIWNATMVWCCWLLLMVRRRAPQFSHMESLIVLWSPARFFLFVVCVCVCVCLCGTAGCFVRKPKHFSLHLVGPSLTGFCVCYSCVQSFSPPNN